MSIPYLSSEIGLTEKIPTYSGGLGTLAGDTAKAAADYGLDMVFVSQLSSQGYATQSGGPQPWKPEEQGLERLVETVDVPFDSSSIRVGAYRYYVKSSTGGANGSRVPVLFLTTDVEGNPEWAKRITDRLYDSNDDVRHLQYLVLGVGGLLMLQRLGINVKTHHINEGHSSLMVLEQLRQAGGSVEKVIEQNVFFNHSIEAATMPKVSKEFLESKLGQLVNGSKSVWECIEDGGWLATNKLAATHSRDSFGVSLQHALILRSIFPGIDFGYVTNAVHPPTWVTPNMAELYDKRIGTGWRTDPDVFLRAAKMSPSELWNAHMKGKEEAIRLISELTGVMLHSEVYTVAFARRATPYKQGDLVFNPEWAQRLADELPFPLQYIQGGKPHPSDWAGRQMMERAQAAGEAITRATNGKIRYVHLPDYNIAIAKLLLQAVDGWLQHPCKGREASATSGMKAALNGISNISPREGWLVEGPVVDGVTGWAFTTTGDPKHDAQSTIAAIKTAQQANHLGEQQGMMPFIISALGSLYHTTRMLRQYMTLAWKDNGANIANARLLMA